MMLTTAAKLEMGIQNTTQNLFNPNLHNTWFPKTPKTKYETSELLMSRLTT